MRVALVHDWLYHLRGGEKVLEALAEIYPEATIYTLFSDRSALSLSLSRMKIKNSFLQFFPGIQKYYRWLLPVLPWVIQTLRVAPVDLVISSSHCVAKGIRVPKGAIHVCYCHTPMRSLWGFEKESVKALPAWLSSLTVPLFALLKKWDLENSRRVHHFLCNSETVRQRILAVYGREAVVVHPPVNFDFFSRGERGQRAKEKECFYLLVSALMPYKRVDLAIEAFKGWDRNLWIVGDGPEKSKLRKKAHGPNLRFLGKISDEALRSLYGRAAALIFPQEEDFGIVPLEAQACGLPVIAYGKGGVLETVKEGVFFDRQTPEALRQAVLDFESRSFDSERLRAGALQFDKAAFKTKITQAIEHALH